MANPKDDRKSVQPSHHASVGEADSGHTDTDTLVSVVVPTKNSARFLDACLHSIAGQTYPALEIIVVDNYSQDDTAGVALRYTDRLFQCGPERSAQVNFGVSQARGRFVYKVDSDFVLDPRVVESCLEAIHRGYDAVVVHNSPDVRVSWVARIRKFEVDMYKYDITHSSARFIKREVYEAVGGFDESITAGEDYDFQNRLTAAGYKTGFVEPEALHLGEPTSLLMHLKKYYAYGRDFVVYARRNPSRSTVQLNPVRLTFLRNWRRFLRQPIIGCAFVAYSAAKFAFGGVGFIAGTWGLWRVSVRKRPDNR